MVKNLLTFQLLLRMNFCKIYKKVRLFPSTSAMKIYLVFSASNIIIRFSFKMIKFIWAHWKNVAIRERKNILNLLQRVWSNINSLSVRNENKLKRE